MLVVDMDMGIGSGAVLKTAVSQLTNRALPAAAKAAGVPSRVERALEGAVGEAVREAVRRASPSESDEHHAQIADLLLASAIGGDAARRLFDDVQDPELPDMAPGEVDGVPALVVCFSSAVSSSFDWSTARLDPVAFDTTLGRTLLTALRAAAVAETELAPLVQAIDLGVRFTSLNSRISNDLRAVRQELANLRAAVSSTDRHSVPPPVHKVLQATGSRARQVLTEILSREDRATLPIVRDLLVVPPEWLGDADGHAWLALAMYLGLHGVHGGVSEALEEAAERGAGDRAALLAAAAFEAAKADAEGRARDLCDRALMVDPDCRSAEAALAVLDADTTRALRATKEWHLGGDGLGLQVAIRAWALFASAPPGHDEAVRLLQAAHELRPDDPHLQLALAEVLLQTAEASPDQARHLRRLSLENAVAARNTLRDWRVPSATAAFTAATAATLLHDRRAALRLLLQPPDGDGTDEEAQDQRCASLAAVNFALVGDLLAARAVRDALPDGRQRWQASVVVAEMEEKQAPPVSRADQQIRDLYLRLLTTSETDGERLSALMGLADRGEEPLPDLAWLRDNYPKLCEEFQAHAALARGDAGAAVRALGGPSSVRTAAVLADAHYRLGELDRAAEVLSEAARRLDEPHLLARRAYLLADGLTVVMNHPGYLTTASSEAVARAQAAAADALAAAPTGPDTPVLLALQAQLSHTAGDWRGCVTLARAALEAGPQSPYEGCDPTRWLVVLSLFNLREEQQAWRALRKPVPLAPRTADQARAALMLAAACADARVLLLEAVDLAQKFANDRAFRDWLVSFFLLVVHGRLRDGGLLDDEGLTTASLEDSAMATAEKSVRTLVHDAIADGEGAGWRVVELPQTNDEIVATLSASVREGQTIRRQVVKALDQGYPLGVMIGKQNYATAILDIEGGVLRVESPDPDFRDHDLADARTAVAQDRPDLAVDLTALHSVVLAPAWAVVLSAESGRLLLTDEMVALAHDARWHYTANTVGTATMDSYGRLRLIEADAAEASARRARAAAFAAATKACVAVCDPGPLDQDPDHSGLAGVWSSSLALARARDVALLSDDAGQRRLARAYGLRCFSSFALARALHERGASNTQPALVAAWRARAPTDIPASGAELARAAASVNYLPGPASWPWMRPITWQTLKEPTKHAVTLLRNVHATAPHTLALWMHDLTVGQLATTNDVDAISQLIFASADGGSLVNPSVCGALLAGAHAACHPAERGDDLLATILNETRRRTGGVNGPGALIYFFGLPPEVASRLMALETQGPG